MANVRFVRTTKQKQINREEYDDNALYFCTDSAEFYRADQLLTDGVRQVATYAELPTFDTAADGILYYVIDSKSGYVLNTLRNGWTQVIYAPTQSEGDNVDSITFAGVEMTEVDGVFSIDREAALNALGISVPEGTEGQETIIATEATVTQMSEELKAYVEEQLVSSGADDGEI
jgi:hypothetical protein